MVSPLPVGYPTFNDGWPTAQKIRGSLGTCMEPWNSLPKIEVTEYILVLVVDHGITNREQPLLHGNINNLSKYSLFLLDKIFQGL